MASRAAISVIIPARDAADTIAGTLRSLAPDKAFVAEVELIDDRSSDSTVDIAMRTAATLGLPLRVIASTGLGPGAARNAGIVHAQGRCIFFLDADDHLQAGGLQVLWTALQTNPMASIAVGASVRRTAYRPDKLKMPHSYGGNPLDNAARYFRNELWPIAIGSALVRTEAIGDVRFPEDIRLDEDTCFWTALLCSHLVTAVEQAVLLYNLDEARMTSRYTVQPQSQFLRIAAAYASLSKYGLDREAIQWRKAWLAMRMVRQLTIDGHYRNAASLQRVMRAHSDFRGSYRDIRYALRTKVGLMRERLFRMNAAQSRS